MPGLVSGEGDDLDDPLSAIRALPQFESMRARVRADPNALGAVIQEMGASNSALLTLIHSNQAAFVQLMNETPDDDRADSYEGIFLEIIFQIFHHIHL